MRLAAGGLTVESPVGFDGDGPFFGSRNTRFVIAQTLNTPHWDTAVSRSFSSKVAINSARINRLSRVWAHGVVQSAF